MPGWEEEKRVSDEAVVPDTRFQTALTTKKPKVVLEMSLSSATEVLTDGAGKEKDHDHSRRDPGRTIKIRVAF